MNSLLLLNGSPRGPRSNSMRMMSQMAEGWRSAGGSEPTVLHLAKRSDFDRAVVEFASAETVLLGMPLYTDSMPALVAEFIEALADRIGCPGNPRLAFLVQSGFNEALHSRGLERYLAKLAARLESPYAGTIVRGSGEALQVMSDRALAKLFSQLQELGGQLARDGVFDAEALAKVARTERLSPIRAVVVSAAMTLPGTQFYWNSQLKKNGAWAQRFDAPYGPAAG